MLEQDCLHDDDLGAGVALTQEKPMAPTEVTAVHGGQVAAQDGFGKLAEPYVVAAEIGKGKNVPAWRAGQESLRKAASA